MKPPPPASSPLTWLRCSLIVFAACLAYHNSLDGPFVFDDESSIVTNPTIRSLAGSLSPPTTNVTAQGRPILNLSLALNHAIGGTAVRGYHVGNLLIHALAGLALFGVVRRTVAALEPRDCGVPPQFAFLVALLWVVHPLQTESVTYVIQRAESLVGLFYLLTLYCFVRAVETRGPARESRDLLDVEVPPLPRRATIWVVLAVAACALGMATKEVMVTAPLMVLFFDRTFFATSFLEALRRRRIFYVALASTWLLLAWLVAQTGGNRGGSVGFGVGIAWSDYWLTQFKAVGHYVWLSLWPHPLVFEYGSFWITSLDEIIVGLVIVFALLTVTLAGLRRRHALGFLGAWFFGILAPTSLAPGTTQMIVEHRMYLPLAAVIAIVVAGIARISRARAAWVLGAMAVALIALTVRRNEDYRSDIVLWTDTVRKAPGNPLAHFMLAGAKERAGDTAGALASYQRALELKPDFSIGHELLGEALLKQGRRAEAIAHFEAALRIQPNYADAHANLGIALFAGDRVEEAVAHLERAVQLAPDFALRRYQFGRALAAAGRAADAMGEFKAAVWLEPNLAEAHYELGNGLAMGGRPRDAIPHYEAALRVRPDYAEAHHNLASALFELGRLAEAVQHYEETLRLRPDFPNARANLERARTR